VFSFRHLVLLPEPPDLGSSADGWLKSLQLLLPESPLIPDRWRRIGGS
jgi:hypothetical protein